jgi:hypothetical protein
MTLQLLYRRFVIREIEVIYRARPQGSTSKLRTFHDGAIVLAKILGIAKAYKPLTFFGGMALLACLVGAVVGTFPVYEYVQYQYVYSVPKAVLAASCFVLAGILAGVGVTISTLNYRMMEMTSVISKQITYSRALPLSDSIGGELLAPPELTLAVSEKSGSRLRTP